MTETRQKKIKIELFKEQETYTIYNGSMLDMLQVIEPNSIDAIVTDPPYELNFMNKGWDSTGIAFNPNTWKKCYEALKPGGYLLAFGGSRTFHRIAVAIEDAGFEIRDTIMWIYGSGFPKSMDISKAIDKSMGAEREVVGKGKSGKTSHAFQSEETTTAGEYDLTEPSTDLAKQWQGWGTALKPAYEPIIVARKPFKGSLVDNILENGVGGINIDECRIPFEDTPNPATNPLYRQQNKDKYKQIEKGQQSGGTVNFTSSKNDISENGRFPSNIIHDDSFQIDEETQASRYFYSAKASKKDRDEGLDGFEQMQTTDGNIRTNEESARKFGANSALRRNHHPTVKPCKLMQYLVRLVAPKGATILDPFMGSGSTGKAVMFENRERNANYKFIGVDLEQKYCEIANARIDYALNKYEYDVIKEQQQAKQRGQANIFDFLEVKE